MKNIFSILPRWFPALFIMVVIFISSSQPGEDLPNFLDWDYAVKKASHVVIYGLLAMAYLHLFRYNHKYYWFAWMMTLLYAETDEFHQSFVPGRSSTVFDVVIFDNIGAIVALWCHSRFRQRNATDLDRT